MGRKKHPNGRLSPAIRIAFLITTFFIFFFVNIPAMAQPCNWKACPDFIGTPIIARYPNFYRPTGIYCGIVCLQYEAVWYLDMILFDVALWSFANVVFWIATGYVPKRSG
jgi:hypothetical protein